MTVVVASGQIWNTTAGNKTVTFTMGAGDLIVVIAATSGLAGGTTAVTDDNSGGGGTYTQVDSDRTGFSTTGVLTAWVRDNLVTQSGSTIVTASQAGSSGGGLHAFRIVYCSVAGTAAIRATGGQSSGTAGTTPAITMSRLPNPRNPMIGAVCNGSNIANVTGPPNFLESGDQGYNSPTTGLEGVYTSDGSGSGSDTITWGSTSATTFASILVEVDQFVLPNAAINHQDPGLLMEGLKDYWRRHRGILVPDLWTPRRPALTL